MSEKRPRTRPRRFDSPQQEAYLNLWRTYDRLRALEDALFARFELTAQQYNALRLLRNRHPLSMGTFEVAERLVSRAPDITRLLDRLAERGLVERARDPGNRRVVRAAVTGAGLALLAELDPLVLDCHRRQLGHLTPEQLQTLTDLLQLARRPHEPPDGPWGEPANGKDGLA